MKKVFILSIISLILITFNVSASGNPTPEPKTEILSQSTSVLKGMIFDNQTAETLAGAVITANGQKVYSDLDGNFSIKNLCNGKCQLKISLISYKEQTIEVDVDSQDAKSIQIKLQQR